MIEMQRLDPSFFNGSTEEIAQKLLGVFLVHQIGTKGLLVKL
jgi:hypothetical protein